jgi:carbamoyl-phosphate synthase large subunit
MKESRSDPSSAKWRVLIFPGGTEIALELRQALSWCKEVQLFSAGAPVSQHSSLVFRHHFEAPMVSSKGWLERIVQLVEQKAISHIFPAHDDALLELCENAQRIPAKIITSPLRTCRITRSKSATIKYFENILPVPNVFETPDAVAAFPVFVKPDRGQGSQQTAIARNAEELQVLVKQDSSRIVCEYLSGSEYTIDCFSDRERGLLYINGRERRRVRSGIAMDSVPIRLPEFKRYAELISKNLELHGAWFFQLKKNAEGDLKLLEIAPRVGGTSALTRVCGVNLPLLSLYEADRIKVEILEQSFEAQIDRALINRYKHSLEFDELYVDFDDTFIVREQLNLNLVKLVFQAIDRGIRVILLTRCAGDLPARLRRWRLEGLFDDVIHLREGEPKSEFIKSTRAILIDDSFRERLEVHREKGIPVFDSSMIELLLDDRI